ncbi:MAG TPA: SCO family protein [Candidatus Limnocylindrales bacterium]|jgi:protein SCO1/2|nr:SCO family protein [Candidatus Limnocylindrales bacterium]
MTTVAIPARRVPWRAIAIVLALATVGLMIAIAAATFGRGPAGVASRFAYADAAPAPALDLVDQAGRRFGRADLRGRPTLLYFGYTHCPDVCPATIGTINAVIAASPEPVQAVFVTVDPERDTVDAMAAYVRYLSTEYIGLTGTPSQVRAAADGYGVTYSRIDTGSAGGYAMAHTAELYLIDARGRLRSHYPFGIEAAEVVHDLRALATE